MNKELKLLQQLDDYENLNGVDKMMLKIELEDKKIPVQQIDMECKDVRDLVSKIVLDEFNDEVDGSSVSELYILSREPRIKMEGGHQIELGVGEDVLILSLQTYKQLKELLNSIDDENIRQQLNGDRWRNVKNLNKDNE